MVMPRYPVYIPSKGRYDVCATGRLLAKDGVPFHLVVEPQEYDEYAKRFSDHATIHTLPWEGDDERRRAFCADRGIENGGLIAARNWIKEHSIQELDAARHWQIDDNVRETYRWYKGERIPVEAGLALRVCEDLTDRYTNVAISGLNYYMFGVPGNSVPPFNTNIRVYSITLVNNAIPHRWRLAYNDDVDICLQVLADGWCTILVNAFLALKSVTMSVKGGNTDDLYQGDGRLRMARSLERMWPGVVETRRRFGRPQHVVKASWKKFDTPLELREDVDLDALPEVYEYGMQAEQVKDRINSTKLREIVESFNSMRQ